LCRIVVAFSARVVETAFSSGRHGSQTSARFSLFHCRTEPSQAAPR
jgi:hypothetical protein